MKLQISVWARNLKNAAGALKGTSDPFGVLSRVAMDSASQASVLGKTEVIKNTLSPDWVKVFAVDYELGTPVKVAVQIFDEVRKGDNKSMGSAVFDVGSLLGAKGSTQAKKIKGGGTIFAHVVKYVGHGTLRLAMKGIKLTNTEGFLRKSDPFFELKKKLNGPHGTMWDSVYRSKHVKDNLNPVWDDAVIDVATLCNGDLSQPILVSVYDHESNGKHVLMGELETTVNGFIAAMGGNVLTLKKKGKNKGHIQVTSAAVSGVDSLTSQMAAASILGDTAPTHHSTSTFTPTAPSGAHSPFSLQTTPPPSFVDYINGGCQLNLSVAIDFTGSNGDPRRPGTLHYMNPDGSMNDYEKAISAIGTILSKYDHDQKFPVWGFGAKYEGTVRHIFQVGSQSEADGVGNIIEAYRGVFRTGLTMSGPTVFTEVIQAAAVKARSQQDIAHQQGEQAYSILLILTDGAVSDVHATAASIKEANDAPLSIVIIGVGNADFSAMRFLDDPQGIEGPDIAQFVQFNAHRHNQQALTSATLEEIPGQLVGYFKTKGIPPLPPVEVREEEIVVSNEDEIDLSLNFGSDGEITVAPGGAYTSGWSS